MISFKEYVGDEISLSELVTEGFDEGAAAVFAEELGRIAEFSSFNPDFGFAVSVAEGCLLVRQYDGEDYSFAYPIPLTSGADASAAVLSLAEYAVKERLQLALFDVPKEGVVESIAPFFRNYSVRAESGAEGGYSVYIYNELCFLEGRISSLPLTDGATSLDWLNEEDTAFLARLNRSPEVNRYWGYDFRADAPNATDEYFLGVCEYEREYAVALTLAVRSGGEFIGEATLYDFDFRGGCQVAVRILPEHWRRGHGTRALGLLCKIAARLGVTSVRATVMRENTASMALFGKNMKPLTGGENAVFYLDLGENAADSDDPSRRQ